MTANASLRDYTILEFLDEISVPGNSELIAFSQENEFKKEYKEILNYATSSINNCANSKYKAHAFLEESDIEKIKNALNNFVNKSEKVNQFKQALIEDLTNFQKQIKVNHVQNISDLAEEKEFCEKQIKIVEFAKHKLVMSRLTKMAWPYDEKTKEYDKKIETLTTKLKNIENSIEIAKTMKPMAKEQEIMNYQIELEKKFGK